MRHGKRQKSPVRLAIVAAITTVITVGSVLTAAQAQASPGPYTALGDSYSSGVGTRTYYDDSGSCYRSPYAYPVLVARRTDAPLTFAACSGARVPDVLNNQLGSLNSNTGLVTISIGGNDAGFADVITQCALPWPWTCWEDIESANNFIRNTLPGRLNNLYNTIRNRAPNAQVIVVGYPRLFNGETCNWAARISAGEQAELNRTADLLATTIGGRAAAHGFAFVDPRSRFNGHAVCDDVEWINGLSNPIRESYHPNRAGQASGYTPLVAARVTSAVPQVA